MESINNWKSQRLKKENAAGSDELLTVCSWEMDNYFFE